MNWKLLFDLIFIKCYNLFMKHIVILRQPFFDMILSGEKTIESRFSFNKTAPYGKVNIGDTLYFKQTGKTVTANAKVKDIKYYELTPQKVEEIRIKFGKQIGTDKFKDWQTTLTKKYCTLIWFKDLTLINEMQVPRSNGAGWIVVDKQV